MISNRLALRRSVFSIIATGCLLSACNDAATDEAAKSGTAIGAKPEWKSIAYEGVQPLMAADDAAAALESKGYVLDKCIADDPVPNPQAKWASGEACFTKQAGGWQAAIAVAPLDRKLHVAQVNFHAPANEDNAANVAALDSLALELGTAFGKPGQAAGTSTATGAGKSYVWAVPGGLAASPDNVTLSQGKWQAPQIAMTSHWLQAKGNVAKFSGEGK